MNTLLIILIFLLVFQLIVLLSLFSNSSNGSPDYTQLATRDIFMTRDNLYKRD